MAEGEHESMTSTVRASAGPKLAFSRRQALQLGAAASALAMVSLPAAAREREAQVGFASPLDDERVRLRPASRPVGPRLSSGVMRVELEGLTGLEESALDDACLELSLDDARTLWMPALHFRRSPVVCTSAGGGLSLPAERGVCLRWSWRAGGEARTATFELGPHGVPLVEGRYLVAASDASLPWGRWYAQSRAVVDAAGRAVALPLAWVRVSALDPMEEPAGVA